MFDFSPLKKAIGERGSLVCFILVFTDANGEKGVNKKDYFNQKCFPLASAKCARKSGLEDRRIAKLVAPASSLKEKVAT